MRRGRPGGRCQGSCRLIVSPLDDQYGDSMADQFNDSVARAMGRMSGSSGDSPTSPVKHFTYIRGLDGAQPGDPASTAATRNRQAHGGRQFDYIERLGPEDPTQ